MQTAGAGGYLQHYEYDGLNRLVKATGRDNTPYGDAQYSHYTMEMAYNAMSSPVKIEKNLNGTFIRNEYLYGLEEHPNAPQQVGETQYTYSKSGNPLTIEGGDVNRTLTWDAENRLRRIYDSRSGQIHLYTYNHLGERALKRYGKAQAMAVNDKDAGALLDTKDNYSAYVSPYFVGHNGRYTKHYYAGAMRIASKMGASGSTYAAGTDEPDLYFYHTDHLGSTTYITDRKEVAQYVAYTPYGETFKEYKNVTPYKFNGKELDQETGYYYYGARYYDPSAALWLGVDPLAEKYPDVSPYVYCAGNPVVRIDPDGRDEYDLNESGNIVARRENNSADIFRFVDKDGKAIDGKSISFKYGTVENVRNQKIKDGSMDVYKVRGDDNAKKLYEFVVDGTKEGKIEWSWFETGQKGDKGLNFVSTSHERSSDASAFALFEGQLKNGYSIRSHTHNHPSGIHMPSIEDKKFYKRIDNMFNYNKEWKGGAHVQPNFQIYTVRGYFDASNGNSIKK